eukprot:TRINITY_DN4148_c0_g1_i1.p1 TRINITY_DN4148_c0_g1~~TRINITY_DN4148_c0_g1_i1.p1  ORF type:complete len:513 (-),score=110.37 TRINITY_DN4148_c0_g1_i1:51-1589(-)
MLKLLLLLSIFVCLALASISPGQPVEFTLAGKDAQTFEFEGTGGDILLTLTKTDDRAKSVLLLAAGRVPSPRDFDAIAKENSLIQSLAFNVENGQTYYASVMNLGRNDTSFSLILSVADETQNFFLPDGEPIAVCEGVDFPRFGTQSLYLTSESFAISCYSPSRERSSGIFEVRSPGGQLLSSQPMRLLSGYIQGSPAITVDGDNYLFAQSYYCAKNGVPGVDGDVAITRCVSVNSIDIASGTTVNNNTYITRAFHSTHHPTFLSAKGETGIAYVSSYWEGVHTPRPEVKDMELFFGPVDTKALVGDSSHYSFAKSFSRTPEVVGNAKIVFRGNIDYDKWAAVTWNSFKFVVTMYSGGDSLWSLNRRRSVDFEVPQFPMVNKTRGSFDLLPIPNSPTQDIVVAFPTPTSTELLLCNDLDQRKPCFKSEHVLGADGSQPQLLVDEEFIYVTNTKKGLAYVTIFDHQLNQVSSVKLSDDEMLYPVLTKDDVCGSYAVLYSDGLSAHVQYFERND